MSKVITILMVFCGLFSALTSCSHRSNLPINSTTHQKYVISESEMATEINVYLDEVPENITFDSIVFNRQQVPVTEEITDKGIKLTAIIHSGLVSQEQLQTQQFVEKPNQLNYSINGKSDYVLLKDVHFLPSKIYLGTRISGE